MGLFGKKEVKSSEKTKVRADEELIFKINLRVKRPVLPPLGRLEDIDVRYILIEPYAYAHIFWDKGAKEVVYQIEEPVLAQKEKETLDVLESGIKELINISFISVKTGEAVISYLEKNVKVLLEELGIKITMESYLKLMYYIYRDFVGLNEVEPLMKDAMVEDIECNGINTPVYVVHRKYRNLRVNITYKGMKKLSNFVEKLAQKCGKHISYASPLLDAALPDGSRVNATFATDVTSRGPTFTIRKFTKEPWSPIRLISLGTVSPEILSYLWLLVEYECNIMVIGGVGSGKTTLLNVLASFIPPQARIVSIEDTRELNLIHENWLPSVARAGIGEVSERKYGEITLFDLLKESFRQRPDYMIVGEIRGKEAYVLFQAAASGHPTMSTMHAESVDTMIRRLETEPINLSPSLVDSLNVVCVMAQTKLKGQTVRRIRDVVEIIKVGEGIANVSSNIPFKWDPVSGKFFYKTTSYMFDKISIKYGVSKEQLAREFNIRAQLLSKMYQNKIVGFEEVQEVINAYYKDPDKILRRFGLK